MKEQKPNSFWGPFMFYIYSPANFDLATKDWGQCDVSCDGGSQSRTRSVAQPKVGEAADCKGLQTAEYASSKFLNHPLIIWPTWEPAADQSTSI